jgi:hypothetical protein
MSRKFLIPLLAAAFLAAPAFAPAPLTAGLSGSAQAQTTPIKKKISKVKHYRRRASCG